MGPVSRTAGLMDWLENENMQHEQTDTIQHTVAGAAHKILRRNTSRLDDGGGSLRRNGE